MVCSSKLKEYFNSKNVTSLVKASMCIALSVQEGLGWWGDNKKR